LELDLHELFQFLSVIAVTVLFYIYIFLYLYICSLTLRMIFWWHCIW